jgi:hypothetical protein
LDTEVIALAGDQALAGPITAHRQAKAVVLDLINLQSIRRALIGSA